VWNPATVTRIAEACRSLPDLSKCGGNKMADVKTYRASIQLNQPGTPTIEVHVRATDSSRARDAIKAQYPNLKSILSWPNEVRR
jgi:hypothetical protein